MTMKLETLPHSTEAEEVAIACLVEEPWRIPDVMEAGGGDLFYGRKELWGLLESCYSSGVPISMLTFRQKMVESKMVNANGELMMPDAMFSTLVPGSMLPDALHILVDQLMRRKALIGAMDVAQAAEMPIGSEFKDAALKAAMAVQAAVSETEHEEQWGDVVDGWMLHWEEMASGKRESAMDTQWPQWNSQLNGIAPGYSIISGTSSSGKSALLGNIMRHSCLTKGRPGLFISYEMPVRMVVSRLIADMADVDGAHVFAPDKTKPKPYIAKAIAAAATTISKSPLRILHNPSLSADSACRLARKMYSNSGDLVVGVDYIQIIPPPRNMAKGSTREREVAANSECFRHLSKEIDCPVIALSQLNWDGTTRESASVNMDCDCHIKVDRWTDPKTQKIVEKGLWVYKNRNGMKDFYMDIKLNGPRYRFEDQQTSHT